jgi:glycosyltransferase involved in cell wall biosynthesis
LTGAPPYTVVTDLEHGLQLIVTPTLRILCSEFRSLSPPIVNILLSNSTDIFAGGEDYVRILAKYLKLRGHNVWVAALPGHLLLEKCAEAGIPTIPMGFSGMGRVFSVASELRRHLRRNGIEIVHSNANYDRTCVAIATAFTRMHHVAGVHSAHSIQHNLTHYLRNRLGTAHFIADAEAIKQVLVEEDGIAKSQITVIPIGVEDEHTERAAEARASFRREIGADPYTIVIGNVARLVPFKGHRYLLETIQHVVREHPAVLFTIVGDGELMKPLTEQAAELAIERQVLFLGFRDNLHQIYPGFDIYCHSSLELAAEAFPLAILRALAMGLPVVSTNVGGIGSMVDDGTSGFLTPPEDPKALAEALLNVIRDGEMRNSMGKASYELFTRKFHASAMAERVEQIYRRALSVNTSEDDGEGR